MAKKITEAKTKKAPIVRKEKDVYDALFAFQGENITVPKRGKGFINGREYAYPMLDDSLNVTSPFLQKHKLMITQVAEGTDLVTVLMHIPSKTKMESKLPLGSQTSSQDLGSRITYLRRYMFNAMLKLPNEDIDGANGAKDLAPGAAAVQPASTAPASPVPNSALGEQTAPNAGIASSLPPSPKPPRSEFFLKAEGAIKSAQSDEAIEQLTGQVKASIRLNDAEKSELLDMLKKEDAAMGTIHR